MPSTLDQVRGPFCKRIHRSLRVCTRDEWLYEGAIVSESKHYTATTRSLTKTLASTTLNPFVPFTLRSGSTTLSVSLHCPILAVPVGCQVVAAWERAHASTASSELRSTLAKGAARPVTKPSHVLAETKRNIERIAMRIA